MEHKKIELKPCPFCGGQAEIEVNPSTLRCVATCKKCSVVMKKNYKGSKRVEEILIEMIENDWNRRYENE